MHRGAAFQAADPLSSVSSRLESRLAGCAGHVQQLGSESLLPNLMEVKG